MSNATLSRPKGRACPPRPTRKPLAVETLEDRHVPSITIHETEPNNTPWETNVIPRILGAEIQVKGTVNTLGDHDWFRIDLQQGDIFGAALNGQGELDPKMDLYNSSGELVMGCDDSFFIGANWLPKNSPLPHHHSSEKDAELYTVITTAGNYYLDLSAFGNETADKYSLDLVVARPGLESQPVGTKQILFVDFDGAMVKIPEHQSQITPLHKWKITPLVDALPSWGLTAADTDAVINEVLVRLTDKLSTFVRANGLNGDFASTGIPGQFDLEIRNSRDHVDEFGTNPLVSRLSIGLSDDPFLAEQFIGWNETIDVGNFQTDDESVVSVNFVSNFLLDAFPVQAPATKIQMAAEYIAIIAAHEFAHTVGCFHTDFSATEPFEGVPTFMDISFESPLGPDLTFGTADDRTLQLQADGYRLDEFFTGLNDTLNTFSFGLSTGKASCLNAAEVGGIGSGKTLRASQIKPLLNEALARWQAAGVDTSGLANLQIRIADLGGTTLGLASGNIITLDDNAAGWGWFVDRTPRDDSEFRRAGNQGEQNRMDLLSVLEHEIGHVLGYEHAAGGVMQETLAAGTRMNLSSLSFPPSWLAGLSNSGTKHNDIGQ